MAIKKTPKDFGKDHFPMNDFIHQEHQLHQLEHQEVSLPMTDFTHPELQGRKEAAGAK